jgi:GNAT superfamily N-acetyltransferase
MDVRRGRLEEGPELADLWLRSRSASPPAIPPPVHPDDEVRTWFSEVVLPQREVWVAQVDEATVGLLVLDGDWVDQLYVEPGRTSQGIGSCLLEVAKSRRPRGLRLWTFQANPGARRFYERHGFTAKATTEGDNEEGAPDVRYEWEGARSGPAT